MKKLLLSLAIVMGVAVAANAQDVGKMWVGGSVALSVDKPKGGDSNLNYNLMPEVGYIFSENMGLGVRVGFGHADAGSTNFAGVPLAGELDQIIVNPFVRYSFLKGELGSLFVDGGIGYHYLKVNGMSDKGNQLDLGFRPGVAVTVSDKIALTGKFGFLGYEYTKLGDLKNNSFGFNFDMSNIELGMSLIF